MSWAADLKVRKLKKEGMVIGENKRTLPISLMFILIIGWLVSITVFLLELAWYHVFKILNDKILEKRTNIKPKKVIKIQVKTRI